MKILVMAGTRPEAIKVAPVVRKLRETPDIETVLCSTGQHQEMLQQAFADFGMEADLHLNVMRPGQSLAGLSSRLFAEVDHVLEEQRPSWVLVQGDTTTVMVSAMCAFYRDIRVGHIEAGLRSFNRRAPFPEEVNRQVVSKVADLHFAPTASAYANLIREGVEPEDARITGNTVIDALLWIREEIGVQEYLLDERIQQALNAGKRLVLVTGHRRENWGNGFLEICRAIRTLAESHEDVVFVYPVHLNPQVQKPVLDILGNQPRVILCGPLSYKFFVALLDASYFVLTDSGGIQEEAPALGKPVLVMRDVTERPEGIKAGVARLVGAQEKSICEQVSILLTDNVSYNDMVNAKSPYGDGHAAERIVRFLQEREKNVIF